MNLRICTAAFCAGVIGLMAFADSPASAAPKKKRVITNRTPVVLTTRPRTRITVQNRSYLDAGTEVLPGERKFMDYALPPTYSPLGVIENTAGYHRSPLPGPFDAPGRNNPWPWHWGGGY